MKTTLKFRLCSTLSSCFAGVLSASVILSATALFAQEGGEPATPKKKPAGKGSSSVAPGEIWVDPARPTQAWDPEKGGPKTEPLRLRVVNFRQSNCRGGSEKERVAFGQRHQLGDVTSGSGNRWQSALDVDVDGNPQTGDWVRYIPFSLAEPLSPAVPQWTFDTVFHGGFSFQMSDRKPEDGGPTETYVNSNESVRPQQPANDWALHFLPSRGKPKAFRSYGAYLWKKENFTPPANREDVKVSLDEKSLLGLYTQRYWAGWDGIRFIVQDAGQFYCSEVLPNDPQSSPTGLWDLRTGTPPALKWGAWNPKNDSWDIAFDPQSKMESKTFNDVQAVGWYIFKEKFDSTTVACKWESFEAYATVHAPQRPSQLIQMKEIKTDGGNLWVAVAETPYDLWREVVRWSFNRGQWCLQPRPYAFDRDGDMGSMALADGTHTQAEPVTRVTIYDALAFLNAWSEREGREPVYYTEASFSRVSEYERIREAGKEISTDIVQKSKDTVYRSVIPSAHETDPDLRVRPTIYVKWDADGYRLPTPSEWSAAWGDAKPEPGEGKNKPVMAGKPNSAGLYDLGGNVWELVWAWGDKLDPDPAEITALGGGFEKGDKPAIGAGPDAPYRGASNVGFRAVRRATGGKAPQAGDKIASGIPVWKISAKDPTATPAPAKTEIALVKVPAGNYLAVFAKTPAPQEMSSFQMATTETRYRDWIAVYRWAVDHGYSFDHDGDMGSHDWKWFFNEHTPDEPVVKVGFHDAMVWCNALSEMQGKKPVFYTDEAKTKVYKECWRRRPTEYRNVDLVAHKGRKPNSAMSAEPLIYMAWDADGYRLPTQAEWQYAYAAGVPVTEGKEAGFPWGKDPAGAGEYGWTLVNSGLRTHPAGTKKANAFGLFDTVGNAIEFVVDSHIKGGDFQRNQTKNPIAECVPYIIHDHQRWLLARVGFLYDDHRAMRIQSLAEIELWAGVASNVTDPDIGFRVVTAPGNYPPQGIAADKPTDAVPLDLLRKKP